ncbi:Nif3-like dinuclear metal center hexameric protein [Bacteroidales bacterium]|nr:Nif3-like dinuclear metal center hexameric protein [Bacteroidales bacterium]
MKLKEIVQCFNEFAPFSYQEPYDNAGIQYGDPETEITGALLSLDITEEIINEAISKKINLVVSHHPLLFSDLKKITGGDFVQKALIKAIKNDICILSVHTNIDAVKAGVNGKISEKLGLKNYEILQPTNGVLNKVVVYAPHAHSEAVKEAMFTAGAGHIGNYSECSFSTTGEGTFKGENETKPYVGAKGVRHSESETRIESIVPSNKLNEVISSMIKVHPYEEVAYDIYTLNNTLATVGSGIIGELEREMNTQEFFDYIKKTFNIPVIRHSKSHKASIKKVALCGGAGSFLLNKAISKGADIFLTGDIKYHQFFEAEHKIILADFGHYESEQYTLEIFSEQLKEKFSNFAVYFSDIVTNPVNYY